MNSLKVQGQQRSRGIGGFCGQLILTHSRTRLLCLEEKSGESHEQWNNGTNFHDRIARFAVVLNETKMESPVPPG
jgi:hypothetical protein